MYNLSVATLFRNEEHSIVEWIEHYLFHGVEHFYLIDDYSDDNSCILLTPYITRGLITIFNTNHARYPGRQRDMYNRYILPLLKESQWLLIIDMDEYMWSPQGKLTNILNTTLHIGQIQVDQTLFGSSGHEIQPKSIVNGFTKRSSEIGGNRKYFVNSNFNFNSLNIHHATFVDKMHEENNFLILYPEYFRYNHYTCQSRDIWNRVKCSRGDSDNYLVRTPESFDGRFLNKEEIEDTGLLEQNRPLLERMGLLS